MRTCTNCGAELQEDAKFCWQCGQKVETDQDAAEIAQLEAAFKMPAPPVITVPEGVEEETEELVPPEEEPEAEPNEESEAVTAAEQESQQSSGAQPPVPPVYNSQTDGRDPYRRKPTETTPGNKNVVFLAIGSTIALIVILIVAIVALLGEPKGNKPADNKGKYYGTSCVIAGVETGAEEEWIDLQKKDRVTLFINGETYQGTWDLDGEELTILQGGDEFRGTLKDGILELNINGMKYTFQSKAAADKPQKPSRNTVVGYWTLLRVESDDPVMCMDEDMVAYLKANNMEIFVNLEEDGTGAMYDFLPRELTWDKEALWEEDECLPYSLKKGQLTVEIYGDSFIFVPGTGEAPFTTLEEYEQNQRDAVDLDWWDGDWYGWWVVTDASFEDEDIIGRAMDCCAVIDTNEDNTGNVKIFDADCAENEYIITGDVKFTAASTERGAMLLESGTFLGLDIEYGDWYVDPGSSIVSKIDNMIVIRGRLIDDADESNWFAYEIYLRPWGTRWEDVRNMDTTYMPFDDMMPIAYDSWYLPLIEAGEEMPATFGLE